MMIDEASSSANIFPSTSPSEVDVVRPNRKDSASTQQPDSNSKVFFVDDVKVFGGNNQDIPGKTNIKGVYFDGFRYEPFTLSNEYAAYFNNIQEELSTKKLLTEDNVYDELVGTEGEGTSAGHPTLAEGDGTSVGHPTVVEDDPNFLRHCFFFDDEKEAFFPRNKSTPELYYFDIDYGIWRVRRTPAKWPGDYYFDDHDGEFYLKDTLCSDPGIYYYDDATNVWRKKGLQGPAENGLRPHDFYFDELLGVWLKRTKDSCSIVIWDPNGQRWIHRDECGCGTSDDWYFNVSENCYQKKEPGHEYQWMQDWNVWVSRVVLGEVEAPKTNFNFDDYFFDEEACEMRKREKTTAQFKFDINNRVNRKIKVLVGKANPRNWYWNQTGARWEYKPAKTTGCCCCHSVSQIRDYEAPWEVDYGSYIEYRKKIVVHKCPPPLKSDSSKECSCTEWDEPKTYRTARMLISPDEPAPVDLERKPSKLPRRLCRVAPLSGTNSDQSETKPQYNELALRIGNIGPDVTDVDIREAFSGLVTIDRIMDKRTGGPTKYAYLGFSSKEAALHAYKTLNGNEIKGNTIQLVFKRL